jgi:hypothetical protein
VTRLSDPGGPDAWNLADLPRLARASLYLGLSMAIGGPSCLVTQSIQYDAPPRRGPVILDTFQLTPQADGGTSDLPPSPALEPVGGSGSSARYFPWQVLSVERSEDATNPYPQLKIDFLVRSDDGPYPLDTLVFLDVKQGNWNDQTHRTSARRYGDRASQGASSSFDQPVEVSTLPFTLPASLTPGCHTITLVVTHDYDALSERVDPNEAFDSRTWWIDVKDANGNSATLDSCFGAVAGKTGVDAGAEAGP